ncbi:hypothetical protein [Stackebrandtia nassauensis]|uniref:Uncharacterized protein n=1 Tax=Stackebrandtia nassauensis (strain DSM 44728 / CIP 108903 / NRRL B-16338 / NBRC 102104 / LLR-40K-21) TaxID=446470 RepID=D3Q7T7_STANL|nr:hypothetical protein [Stackebrandtia nassauensis]ADD44429.1 hypothetical protein Snas_4788 [Stackebrandtia nassauensis DSM 44728]
MELRANAVAARIAGVLALVTGCAIGWFALQDIFYLDAGMTGGLTSMVLVNVLGGAVGAGTLLVAAGFTFARRIAGAWTLFGLCLFYAVANTVLAPVLWGVSIGEQLEWIFGFDKANGIAVGVATIFAILTAGAAGIAASMKSVSSQGETARR